MKNIIRLEEAAMLGLSIYVLGLLHAEWWWYLILFIVPDSSLLGYLGGNKAGAACYNLFHHKGVAIFFYGWFIVPRALDTRYRHSIVWSFIDG